MSLKKMGAKARKKYINPTSIAVSVASAVGLLILLGVAVMNAQLRPVSTDTTEKLVQIPQKGTKQLASLLKHEHLIRSGTAFRLLAKTQMALGKCSAPKAGYYDISPSMSSEAILDLICAGKVAKRKVTFPEGFTVKQMGERVEERLNVPAAEFERAARGAALDRALPFRVPRGSLEGYLFPTTYGLPVGEKASFVVSEMVAGFNEAFYKPNAAAIEASKLKLNGIVTLASLVEREARVPKERPIIAGVLMNRLAKGMRLQCDATVQYALPDHRARLTFADLKVDSPYNTYLHAGLPPGAICNPGLDCLMAALKPASVPYLFYVARANGTHVFTTTYEQHLQAIKQVRGR